MDYIYAALLLHSAKKPITPQALTSIAKCAGIEPDEAKAKMVCTALEGANIEELLKNAAAAPVMMAAPAAGAAPAEAKKEEKKEEKKSEEEAAAGLAGLFG